MNLTQKLVGTLELPKGKSEAILFDSDLPGFGIRIRRGGARTWIYQYKIGAKHRRITLGNVAALSAAQARKTASELHARVRLSEDPAGAKAEGRARAAETTAAALASYLPYQRSRLKPRSYAEVERHLLKHCKPLHGLQLGKVDRRTVAARITAIATKSGAVTANRVRASLAAFFAWALREGLAENSPVTGTGRRPELSRERVLAPAELKAIWAATDGGDDYSAIVRLLLLTALRANEVAGLRWSEIGTDEIILAPERTKNSRRHTVPISEPVRAIIEGRASRGTDEFLFGRRQNRPFSGWSKSKALLDERLRAVGVTLPAWTIHDVRRSCATHMAEIGIAPHVIEAVLNHVSGHKHGVGGIYNRADYGVQRRQALTLWSEHLLAIVEGRAAAVVSMRA